MGHGCMGWRTVEKEALEGLLYVELCVEDDQPEADGESVVAGAAFEEAADGIQGGVVGLLEMRDGPLPAC